MQVPGRKQALSFMIIQRTKQLYQQIKAELDIQSPEALAAGLYFMNRYYQTVDQDPPEYGLFAIAALHLASKVCESRARLKRMVELIVRARKHARSEFEDLFMDLDGIPQWGERMESGLTRLLVNREMKIVSALNWDFSVPKTYELAKIYIGKIVKWHIPHAEPTYLSLTKEISGTCEKFLNDLQYTSIFYEYGPEMIALAAVKLSFDRLQLPLVSPKHSQWWTFLVPISSDSEELSTVFKESREFFEDIWRKRRLPAVDNRKTDVSDDQMKQWHQFPVLPLKDVPICSPPSFEMLDEVVKDDSSFKNMDASHLPELEPPDRHPSPLFEELAQEMILFRRCQKQGSKERKEKEKEKEKKNHKQPKRGPPGKRDSPPRHGRDRRYDGRRRDSPPPPPRRRDDWSDHRDRGRRRDSDGDRPPRDKSDTPREGRREKSMQSSRSHPRLGSPPKEREQKGSNDYRRRDRSPPPKRRERDVRPRP